MTVDVAVIGGGLAGCATACYLAREGVDVRLLERGDLNIRASGANAGSIHLQLPHETFVEEGEDWARGFAPALRLMAESIDLWRGLSADLGEDLEFAQGGGLLAAETEEQLGQVSRKRLIEAEHDVPVEMLDRDRLRETAPYLSETMIGAAFCPLEGKANPLVATIAYARAARRAGAVISTGTAVESIYPEDAAYALDLGHETIRARRVVNAAGVETSAVAAMLGFRLDIEGHPLQVTVTAPVAPVVPHLVYFAGGKLTLKQSKTGSLLIGGGWPSRRSDMDGRLSVDPDSIGRNLEIATRVVPAVGGADVARVWPAIVNGTEDWLPILGEMPGGPGFYTAFFPWMGFTAGPVVGRITADLILGRRDGADVAQFSAARYGRAMSAA